MVLNPKGTQVQWVMRALQTMTGDDALEFDRLVGELDALCGTVEHRLRRSGLGGAAWPNDLQHSQASYSIRPSDRPRVLVVNETSKLPNNHWHLGCHLVSCRLRQSIDEIGAECVGWANDLAGVNQILRRDPTAQFEGVIINGEGTLHDDADRAFEIGLIGEFFKEPGKKVFLINSVWEQNSARLEQLVKGFDLIAVRDSRSKANLLRLRDDVRVVPDLCWLEDEEDAEAGDVPCAILDFVSPETSERLEAVAATTELPTFVMSRFFEAFNRAISNGQPAASMPRVLQKPDIRRYQRWLGGRFHGVVLALGAGVPALCLASNTTKIEGMLDDIGLERKLLEVDALDRLKTVPDVQSLFAGPRGYTESDWAKVRAYKAAARGRPTRCSPTSRTLSDNATTSTCSVSPAPRPSSRRARRDLQRPLGYALVAELRAPAEAQEHGGISTAFGRKRANGTWAPRDAVRQPEFGGDRDHPGNLEPAQVERKLRKDADGAVASAIGRSVRAAHLLRRRLDLSTPSRRGLRRETRGTPAWLRHWKGKIRGFLSRKIPPGHGLGCRGILATQQRCSYVGGEAFPRTRAADAGDARKVLKGSGTR